MHTAQDQTRNLSPATRAFTLLELAVVIVVVGVLAAIALFGYRSTVNNTNDASAKAAVQQMAHDATGKTNGTWQTTDFSETIESYGNQRFDEAGEIAGVSTRFGQFSVAVDQSGKTAGIAVRSKTGRCATGIANLNAAVTNLKLSDGIPAVCAAYASLAENGYIPAPPQNVNDADYDQTYDEYVTAMTTLGQTPEPKVGSTSALDTPQLFVIATGVNTYKVHWTSVNGADGYRLYRLRPWAWAALYPDTIDKSNIGWEQIDSTENDVTLTGYNPATTEVNFNTPGQVKSSNIHADFLNTPNTIQDYVWDQATGTRKTASAASKGYLFYVQAYRNSDGAHTESNTATLAMFSDGRGGALPVCKYVDDDKAYVRYLVIIPQTYSGGNTWAYRYTFSPSSANITATADAGFNYVDRKLPEPYTLDGNGNITGSANLVMTSQAYNSNANTSFPTGPNTYTTGGTGTANWGNIPNTCP